MYTLNSFLVSWYFHNDALRTFSTSTLGFSTLLPWGFPTVPGLPGQNASKESIRKAILRGKLKMTPGSSCFVRRTLVAVFFNDSCGSLRES